MSKLPYFYRLELVNNSSEEINMTVIGFQNSLDVGAKMFQNMAVIINKQLHFFSRPGLRNEWFYKILQ